MGSTLVRARGLAKAFGKGHARVPVLAGADLEVAPICALAGPSEILVSQTIRDLVARSGLRFEDKGTHPVRCTNSIFLQIGWIQYRVAWFAHPTASSASIRGGGRTAQMIDPLGRG